MKNNIIPDQDFNNLKTAVMADYSTGALTAAQMLAIDSYLSFNKTARADVLFMDSIGGAILDSDDCDQTDTDTGLFERICDRIDDESDSNSSTAIECQVLPQAITHYINGDIDAIEWKKLAPGIEYYDLDVPMEKGEKAQLLKMAPGKSVFEHSHDGLELTVVLDGAFHDDTGAYHRGDMAIEQGHGHAHAPVADDKQGCICLAVTSAPLHFTGLLGAIINPFVK